jgi:hypothetical protein
LLPRLAILLGWCGALFAVQTSFAMATFTGVNAEVAAVYLLGLAATFPLHGKTRGPVVLVVAFGLCSVLLVEGVWFAVTTGDVPLARRLGTALSLALPLFALVVRRFSLDEEDAWFARHARRFVPLALAVAAPSLILGMLGARQADPSPYDRAERALGYSPLEDLVFEGVRFDRRGRNRSRWAAFQSAGSEVAPDVRAEVNRDCARFGANDPERACACADELLISRSRVVGRRREGFSFVALASSLPWAIAMLFAWRGRRPY